MSFQRLLCLFGIHKYETILQRDYEEEYWNDWYEQVASRSGKVFYFQCQCCQHVKRKTFV